MKKIKQFITPNKLLNRKGDDKDTDEEDGDMATKEGNADASKSPGGAGSPSKEGGISITDKAFWLRLKRNFPIEGAFATTLILTVLYLVEYDYVSLAGATDSGDLAEYWQRIEFVFRQLTWGIVWLLFSLNYVVYKRFVTRSVSGREKYIQAANHIFANSLEQFILTSVGQLIVASHLDSSQLVKIIPLVNIFFFIGRVAYFFGYPQNRDFVWIFTIAPTQLIIIFNAHKLIQSYGVYNLFCGIVHFISDWSHYLADAVIDALTYLKTAIIGS